MLRQVMGRLRQVRRRLSTKIALWLLEDETLRCTLTTVAIGRNSSRRVSRINTDAKIKNGKLIVAVRMRAVLEDLMNNKEK